MQDGNYATENHFSPEELDEMERVALEAAVAEALADPRPTIPNEVSLP